MNPRDERTVLFQLPTVIAGQLVCTQGTLAGRSWRLSAGTFNVGRAAECDLVLAAEPGVSKLHAKLIAEGDHYVLVDNESRNGTIVNGKPVQKVRLQNGDQIRICNCLLRFSQTGGSRDDLTAVQPLPDEPPSFEQSPETAPEVADLGAQQLSLAGDEEPSLSFPPRASTVQPTMELGAVGAASSELAPLVGPSTIDPLPPLEKTSSTAPYFFTGLLLMVVVGTLGWAGLRFAGEELLGPLPGGETQLAKAEASSAGAPPVDEKLAYGDEGAAAAAAKATEPADGDKAAAESAAPPDEKAAEAAAEKAEERAEERPADGAVARAETPPAASPVVGRKAPKSASAAKTVPEESGEGDAPSESPRPASSSSSSSDGLRWYVVVVEQAGPEQVKARASGPIAEVAASDGQSVKKGELLFSLEDASTAEITNLRANIEALEAVAESQPSAQEMLEREKDKLQKLLARGAGGQVTAPASGTLKGFTVKAGDRLKAGDVVGTIEGGRASITATVSAADGKRIKKGSAVELRTRSGVAIGTVAATRKKGGSVVVEIEADAADVTEARFP